MCFHDPKKKFLKICISSIFSALMGKKEHLVSKIISVIFAITGFIHQVTLLKYS